MLKAATNSTITSIAARELGSHEVKAQSGLDLIELFADLEGTTVTNRQRLAAASVTAIARLYDDAFDLPDEIVETPRHTALISAINGKAPEADLDPRLAQFARIAGENMGDKAHEALCQITEVQVETLRQRDPSVTIAEVTDITRRKGALYVLLFALNISPDMPPSRKTCWEALGYLFQLIDDFSDEEQDNQEGVLTLVTMGVQNTGAVLTLLTQRNRVKALFAQEYTQEKLKPLYAHIDKLMAKIGFIHA